MNPTLFASLRTLITDPDRPDRDALFSVLGDTQAARVLACLAPPGSLLQIAAALRLEWSWVCNGWERHTNDLVAMITDPRCSVPKQIITTWSCIPNAVNVLRDRTDTLIAWAQQRLGPSWYADLATLLGPSDKSARLLVQSPFSSDIGTTLRRWSMVLDPSDPTAWQTMIDPDMRAALHQSATPSRAFPAWGWDNEVDSADVLRQIVNDLLDGWSPAHPSLQGRITWLEGHAHIGLDGGELALVASISRSDALAEAVCARLGHDPSSISRIAEDVPWSRLPPMIQTIIDSTMRQASSLTWACAIGQAPVERDTIIDPTILFWRIEPERWETLDAALRADLVVGSVFPTHCYGWGVHPDLVGYRDQPYGKVFRIWNPDVLPDDLLAWTYADLLWTQKSLQKARDLIVLLTGLPPDRRARFAQIIDWRLNGRTEPNAQPPWDWTTWASLPAADRQRRLRARLRVLWGNRTTAPAYRAWMARSHLLDTVAVAVRDLLDSKQAPHMLAALLAQIPALQVHMPNSGPTLPFPNDLDAARCAQIEQLPLDRNTQTYAAWCLRVLEQDMVLGSTLIALHPDVVVALAPVLTAEQRAMMIASPAAQGWDSRTVIHWAAAYEKKEESISPPIQRRIL